MSVDYSQQSTAQLAQLAAEGQADAIAASGVLAARVAAAPTPDDLATAALLANVAGSGSSDARITLAAEGGLVFLLAALPLSPAAMGLASLAAEADLLPALAEEDAATRLLVAARDAADLRRFAAATAASLLLAVPAVRAKVRDHVAAVVAWAAAAEDVATGETTLALLANFAIGEPSAAELVGAPEAAAACMARHADAEYVQRNGLNVLVQLVASVTAEAVPAVVAAMETHSGNAQIQRSGNACLAKLLLRDDVSRDVAAAIGKCNGMAAVSGAMVAFKDADTQMMGVAAMANLARAGVTSAAAAEAVHEALVAHPDSKPIQEYACMALAHMAVAGDSDVRAFIVDAALSTVVAALRAHAETPSIQRMACAALAQCGNGRKVLDTPNALAAVAAALETNKLVLQVAQAALAALQAMAGAVTAEETDAVDVIRKAILDVLAIHPASAAACVANLAVVSAEIAQSLLEANALEIIIQAGLDRCPDDDDVQSAGCAAIARVAGAIPNRAPTVARLLAADAGARVVRATANSANSARCAASACAAVGCMAGIGQVLRMKLNQDDAASLAVVGAMQRHAAHAAVQEHGSLALANLRLDRGGEPPSDAVLKALVDAMEKHKANPAVQRAAAAALAQMIADDDSGDVARRVAELGGHKAIADAMRAHPDDAPLQEAGTAALRNMAAACPDLVAGTDGVIDALVAAANAHPDNKQIQEAVVGALANMCQTPDGAAAVAKATGAIPLLLASVEAFPEAATTALVRLAATEEGKKAILDADGLAVLLHAVESGQVGLGEDATANVVEILAALASVNDAARDAVADSEAVGKLAPDLVRNLKEGRDGDAAFKEHQAQANRKDLGRFSSKMAAMISFYDDFFGSFTQ